MINHYTQIFSPSSLFLIISLLVSCVYTQQYTFPFEDDFVISQLAVIKWKGIKSITHDFKIKDCPTRNFLIGVNCIDNYLPGFKLIQFLEQSKISISQTVEEATHFGFAEICIQGVYVHSEEIDVDQIQFKDTFTYKSYPQNYKEGMKSIPYITGYDSKGVASIFIESSILISQGFEFTFRSTCQNCITKLRLIYLYYEENFSTYFKIDEIIESKYKIINPVLQSGRTPTIQIDLPNQYFCKFNDISKCCILYGLDGIGVQSNISYSVEIGKAENKLNLQYNTWKGQLNGITTRFAVFQMVKCNSVKDSKNVINHKGQCIEKCPVGYYMSNDEDREINICKQCDKSCKTCIDFTKCLSCNNKQYLYQNKCQNDKPPNTYCINKSVF